MKLSKVKSNEILSSVLKIDPEPLISIKFYKSFLPFDKIQQNYIKFNFMPHPTYQILDDLLDASFDAIDALLGPLEGDLAGTADSARKADDHTPVVLGDLVNQLNVRKFEAINATNHSKQTLGGGGGGGRT